MLKIKKIIKFLISLLKTQRELDNIKGVENRAQIWYNYSQKIGAPYDWEHKEYHRFNLI